MDSWTESQLTIMKQGGNDKCNEYLKMNGITPVSYSTVDAVNGGIKKKYDNDVALLYKLKLKAKAEGKPEPTSVPPPRNKNYVSASAKSGASGGTAASSSSSSGGAAAAAANDPNGMERLRGESDSQYIERQTRLREEAKARMAAKFGNGTGGNGKRTMGGVGSTPHPSQQSGGGVGGIGGFNLDSLTSGLANVTTTATSGFGSAWSLAKETVNQTTTTMASSKNGSGVGVNMNSSVSSATNTVSDFGSSLWSSISHVSKEVAKEINVASGGGGMDDGGGDDTFSELNQRMKSQRGRNQSENSSTYAGFGSHDLMAKSNSTSSRSGVGAATTATTTSTSAPSNVIGDVNGIAALPNETDQQYMERQLRIQQEAKARMAAKFGKNPSQAMNSMSVGTTTTTRKSVSTSNSKRKPKAMKAPVTDDFFASFGA